MTGVFPLSVIESEIVKKTNGAFSTLYAVFFFRFTGFHKFLMMNTNDVLYYQLTIAINVAAIGF